MQFAKGKALCSLHFSLFIFHFFLLCLLWFNILLWVLPTKFVIELFLCHSEFAVGIVNFMQCSSVILGTEKVVVFILSSIQT